MHIQDCMNEQHLQAFRARNSSEVITIPTRHDPKSSQHVIFWKDIQQYFENARGVLSGNNAVLFLTDDDFEYLTPLRIAYHPNVILDVLVMSNNQSYLIITEALRSASRRIGFGNMASILGYPLLGPPVILVLSIVLVYLFSYLASTAPHSPTRSHSMYPHRPWASPQGEIQHHLLQRNLDRQGLIQYRVQTLLSAISDDLPAPRLFIILPKDSDSDNNQGIPDSWPSRLHFLCGCGSHTMSKGARKVHEVHLTNHLGYDIKSPKEFLDKYGSYALTMMYMVRYGATSSGVFVPPLAQSNIATAIEKNQGSSGSDNGKIGQLVDDTIAYLEDMSPAIDSNTDATPQWVVNASDLEELKSYLDINDENFPGGLHQLITQEEHFSWVCVKHRLEWTMQQLKDTVNSVGGSYTENQQGISIKVFSDKTLKRLYNAVVDVFKIQDYRSGILLTMDCGRLSLKIDDSQEVQNVSMTITRLSDLTSDDLEFVYQTNITQLKIKHSPKETDEYQLRTILNQSVGLRELEIGCHYERALAIINTVIARREMILQGGGSSALHIFKVTDDQNTELAAEARRFNFLDPLAMLNEAIRFLPASLQRFFIVTDDVGYEKDHHITTTMTFSEDSATFGDMETYVKLHNNERFVEKGRMSDFFRLYGWSISTLNTMSAFNDHLAMVLDEATRTHGSQLTHLILFPVKLTTSGLDAMDRVIKRSPKLEYLWLFITDLNQRTQLEKAVRLLGLCEKKLNDLYLVGNNIEKWLPQLATAFPHRNNFPMMSKLEVGCRFKRELPHEGVEWLATMVSTPSSLGTHLKYFRLKKVSLQSRDWETLIRAIDFSRLEHLRFDYTNFSQEQLDVLIDCIAATDATLLRLRSLDLVSTDLLAIADKQVLQERILKVAPQVSIFGL